MNRKWSEKTTLQKVMDIISGVALCAWLIFGMLERANKVQYADFGSSISVIVICVCEAISLWNVKRSLSYVAIAGAIFMTVIVALQVMLLA